MKELLKRRLTFLLALSLCVSMIQMPGAVVYAEENEEAEFLMDDFSLIAETEDAPIVMEESPSEDGTVPTETVEVDDFWSEEVVLGEETQQIETEEVGVSEENAQEEVDDFASEISILNEAVPASWIEEEVSGSLHAGENTVFVPAGETVYYCFVPERTEKYSIESDVDMDTVGYLFDEEFEQIAYDDDSGYGNNFSMRQTLEAGKNYYIGIG